MPPNKCKKNDTESQEKHALMMQK